MTDRLMESQPSPEYKDLLESTLPIVREACKIALDLQRDVLKIDIKEDRSPVTHVDHAIEQYLFDELGELCPEDGFKGEESRIRPSQSEREWVVDPIDGTVQFIRGQEFWSILVGLEERTVGKLGVIAFPARNEIIYASAGNGCWEETSSGTRQLNVSGVLTLEDSYVLHNGVEFARRANRAGRLSGLLTLVGAERGYADAFGHMEVVRGRSDCMIDFLTEHHDIAAVRVAVQEAGGHWSALDGSQTLNSDSPGSITTNGHLHSIIRDKLAHEDV